MDKRMDEILRTVAREANGELDFESLRGSIGAEYKKRLRARNIATRWISAAAAVIVLAGVGIFANRNPMLNSAPKAEERMDSFAAEALPEGSYSLAGENEAFEAPQAPAEKAPEPAEERPEAPAEPYEGAGRGEVLSSKVIDAGIRTFSGSEPADIIPNELPNGWTLAESDGGWTVNGKDGGTLDCRRVDRGTLTDQTDALKMKQLALGQAALANYGDGSIELYYRAAEGAELYFYGKAIDENTLLDIALSVGEPAKQ
jgi:hypothetical protein